jgi:hypothetical protein
MIPRRTLLLAALATPARADPPPGFTFARTGKGAPGTWSLDQGTLTQTGTDPTDYRFPLAIQDSPVLADLEATVRFKAIAGRVDRAGGLVIRYQDPDNYYVVRANALEDNVNFYRVKDGSRRQIEGASAKVPSGTWHTLSLGAKADRFEISFNGKTLFTATDRSFPAPGRIGVWTKADSVTSFRDLAARPFP